MSNLSTIMATTATIARRVILRPGKSLFPKPQTINESASPELTNRALDGLVGALVISSSHLSPMDIPFFLGLL